MKIRRRHCHAYAPPLRAEITLYAITILRATLRHYAKKADSGFHTYDAAIYAIASLPHMTAPLSLVYEDMPKPMTHNITPLAFH